MGKLKSGLMQKLDPTLQDKSKFSNSYIKYTSISFQMLAIILVFSFVGNQVNIYMNLDKPYVTALFAILGIALALYIAIRKID